MRYLIKETATATKKNKNFYGKTEIFFNGKNGHFERALDNPPVPSYFIKPYAYSSEGRARAALKSIKKQTVDDNWEIEFEIIEVNC